MFHPPDEKRPGTAARYCARSLVNPLALYPKHSKYVPSNAELFSALPSVNEMKCAATMLEVLLTALDSR